MTCPNSIQLDLNNLSEFCYIQQLTTGCLAQNAYYIETKDKISIIIDPLRDIDQYIKLIEERKSKLKYVFVTHFHADFVSGHVDLANKTQAEIVFGPEAKADFKLKETKDGEIININENIQIKILHTPGHTLESSCYLLLEKKDLEVKQIGVFTGDTLFLGEVGRPDLAVKSDLNEHDLAAMLFESIQKLKALDGECVVFPGHGAGSACGKNIQTGSYSKINIQKETNYALNDNLKKEEFIEIATSNLPTPPHYFFLDAILNKQNITHYDDLLKKSLNEISADEFEKLMKDKNVNVIDSRSVKSVYEFGIPVGAVNISIDSNFAIYSATIYNPKNKTIIISDIGREEESIKRLTRVGFENIEGYLKGGVASWISANKPIKKPILVLKDDCKDIVEKRYVLDVRNPQEYKCPGNLKNSLKIPLSTLEENINKVSMTDRIYCLCKTGIRATMAATLLIRHGFENEIYILEGGITNLIEKGIVLESS